MLIDKILKLLILNKALGRREIYKDNVGDVQRQFVSARAMNEGRKFKNC